MISRLLIANRGEIAVRVARTAHRLGMSTVGVYSEPDVNALHVDRVDVAVALGGATPAESYLRGDVVIAAALETGCDAVHPGYGFLAENAEFAQAVIDAGLTWVGPAPAQIKVLGDKVAAKSVAIEAGVPTTPIIAVSPGAIPTDVPMPALVKAAAGGGGRGMRIVREGAELAEAVAAAAREAESAFGDETVFIEPFIEHGRHVEVQIFGDAHGNVVHLGERECSIQRRNQKVIEEAPSAGIDDATRAQLTEGAVALARHVGYKNAGTVEFLVGPDRAITFLEVNTRLQVEHPVTEAVTNLDLVELQLMVAAGEPLPVSQDDVVIDGHAIEVRLVAEDPALGWLPSTGTVREFAIGDGVRVDTGFRAGGEVSADYDSLLAKVIAHAPSRAAAASRLRRALRTAQVVGVSHNINSLVDILGEPDYLAANTPTSYLDDHPSVLKATGPRRDERVALLLGALFALEQHQRARDSVTGFAPSGWRNLRTQGQRQRLLADGEEFFVEYVLDGAVATVQVGMWPSPLDDGTLNPDDREVRHVRLLARSADRQVIELDGVRRVIHVAIDGARIDTHSSAGSQSWVVPARFEEHEAEQAGSGPVSPLPGTVIAVHAHPGQRVADGAVLVVVEAMKMEHKITATRDAMVDTVHFGPGDRVDTGDLLVSLTPIDE